MQNNMNPEAVTLVDINSTSEVSCVKGKVTSCNTGNHGDSCQFPVPIDSVIPAPAESNFLNVICPVVALAASK